MKKINRFNPEFHKGYLPVRVLNHNYMHNFINITPDFKTEFEYEVEANNLADKIKLDLRQTPIREVPFIGKSGIHLFENFNQFLWCCSYAMFVVFDEGVQKPTLNGEFNGGIDLKNPS